MRNPLSHNKKNTLGLVRQASLLVLSLSLAATSSAAIYYVDDDSTATAPDGTSWSMAYPTIQQAIDAAINNRASQEDPAQVWVAEGTYTSTSDNIVVLTPYVDLLGGFNGTETMLDQRDWSLNLTVIDGEENRRGVLGSSFSTLDGFQVINCLGTRGGGMVNTNCSPIIVNNTVFLNNRASDGFGGAGAGIMNTNTTASISSCTFQGNTTYAGGGICNSENSEVTITNSIFKENHANGSGIRNESDCLLVVTNSQFLNNTSNYGGGVFNEGGSINIDGCTFQDNIATRGSGGGLYNRMSGFAIINACTFDNNTASWGGGFFNEAPQDILTDRENTILTNCIISNNTAEHGGAFDSQGSILEMKNCTVVNNHSDAGPSVRIYQGDLNTINSIYWGKQTTLSEEDNGDINATYCCVYTGFDGEGNTANYPLFWSLEENDFRLHKFSPCLNSGTLTEAPETDIQGTVRPVGEGIDMGAYELNEPDTDGDGLADVFEERYSHTDPELYDTDGDSIPDFNEWFGYTRWFVNAESVCENPDGTSWETAFPTIQQAVDLAMIHFGGDVWVAKGTYTGTSDHVILSNQLINLYGGFSGTETFAFERDPELNRTVIDGE